MINIGSIYAKRYKAVFFLNRKKSNLLYYKEI